MATDETCGRETIAGGGGCGRWRVRAVAEVAGRGDVAHGLTRVAMDHREGLRGWSGGEASMSGPLGARGSFSTTTEHR